MLYSGQKQSTNETNKTSKTKILNEIKYIRIKVQENDLHKMRVRHFLSDKVLSEQMRLKHTFKTFNRAHKLVDLLFMNNRGKNVRKSLNILT